jgi:hypothetical protein
VALRTARLPKEKGLAAFGIAWKLSWWGETLQVAQMANHGLNPRAAQRTKGWHSRSRYAVLDNQEKSLIRQLLDLTFIRDVGRMLPASSVQSMASGTIRGKYSLAFESIATSVRWRAQLLRLQISRRKRPRSKEQQYQHRQSQKSARHSVIFEFSALPDIANEYMYTTMANK